MLGCLYGGLLGWRGRRRGALLAAACAGLILVLALPMVSGLLMLSLEAVVPRGPFPTPGCDGPGAIVVLGAEVARGQDGLEPGPLTLERLRAAAALHRRTGLPILVTGGSLGLRDIPLATVMQRSLVQDFAVPVRWVEPRAVDTAQNAARSAAMLREAGICAAYVVTHAWHLPRALEAFARQPGPVALPAPVRYGRPPEALLASNYLPRVDYLADSWFALREWAGRLVYAIRD